MEWRIDARGNNRLLINNFLQQRIDTQDRLFAQAGIDLFDVTSGSEYIATMVSFFYKRMLLG